MMDEPQFFLILEGTPSPKPEGVYYQFITDFEGKVGMRDFETNVFHTNDLGVSFEKLEDATKDGFWAFHVKAVKRWVGKDGKFVEETICDGDSINDRISYYVIASRFKKGTVKVIEKMIRDDSDESREEIRTKLANILSNGEDESSDESDLLVSLLKTDCNFDELQNIISLYESENFNIRREFYSHLSGIII